MNTKEIGPKDKVCWNCKFLINAIAIGQGLRCNNPKEKGDRPFPPIIPRRNHSCGLFEFRETQTVEKDKK